jgi:4-aminobutyrate aminotransferase-like enzyme
MLFRFAADPPFSHITTFGGHPVSCAAGLEGMRIIRDERLLENAQERGAQLRTALERMKGNCALIRDVRGLGLMIGVELTSENVARQAVTGCLESGLIVESTLLAGQTIRFSPPLIVTAVQCEEALETFGSVLRRIQAQDCLK